MTKVCARSAHTRIHKHADAHKHRHTCIYVWIGTQTHMYLCMDRMFQDVKTEIDLSEDALVSHRDTSFKML